ncbi:MAG TPA: hypothetical protein ENI73_10165 [Spirochaetes bacterium]|nr:hypothetical protein [Spirochaetota bacterium]
MKLELTELELKQLVIWADHTIAGGHFGDGNVVFPEEGITLDKLKNSQDGTLEIRERDVQVMIIWCENAIGKTLKGMTSEEISLIAKLEQAQEAFS